MIDLRTGDCISLAKGLEDNSIDCTVTSPPYNKGGIGGGLFRKIEYAAFDDTLPEEQYQEQQIELLDILFEKTKVGGSLFYNHKVRYLDGDATSPWEWLVKTKWNIREEIVWNRGSGPEISGYRFVQSDERIYWLCKGKKHPKLPRRSVHYNSVWKFGPEMKNPHPAPYPIQLPARCIQAVMSEPGVILDPYSGSGTTGLAATLLGHDYIGFDLSDEYHEMARKRLAEPSKNDLKKFSDETGVAAVSESDVFSLAAPK
jgi:modification methylase